MTKRQADLEAARRAAHGHVPQDHSQGTGPVGGDQGDGPEPQASQQPAGGLHNDQSAAGPSSQPQPGAAQPNQHQAGQSQHASQQDREAQRLADNHTILTGNQRIRTLIDGTFAVNNISVDTLHKDMLDELVISLDYGREGGT